MFALCFSPSLPEPELLKSLSSAINVVHAGPGAAARALAPFDEALPLPLHASPARAHQGRQACCQTPRHSGRAARTLHLSHARRQRRLRQRRLRHRRRDLASSPGYIHDTCQIHRDTFEDTYLEPSYLRARLDARWGNALGAALELP